MRFIAIYRPDGNNNAPPTAQQQEEMGKFIHEAVQRGVLIATEGFGPSGPNDSKMRLARGKVSITDGPFAEAKEVIGGFALMQVKSKSEVLEWTRRFLAIAGDGEAEVRQLFDMSPIEMVEKELPMRIMVLVKASPESEAGAMPDEKMLREMGKFNQELVKAGVMLAGEGLHPSSRGARVKFAGGKPTVIDGPFAEAKELVGGYWIWQVKSLAEAIEWLKRAPFVDGTIELRPVFEPEDFGKELTPELRAHNERLQREIDKQRSS